jgi:hypothetical protein
MKPYVQKQTTSTLVGADSLDQIRMSPHDRRMAKITLGQAELIVAILIRAYQDLREVFELIGRGARALAHHSKASAKTPEFRLP